MGDIYAESVSHTHVDAALGAASSGDTVHVPDGESDWNGSSVTIPENVDVIGNGIDSSKLTDPQFTIGKNARLSAFTIYPLTQQDPVITASSTDHNDFRIDHIKFYNSTTNAMRAIQICGPDDSELCPCGLIDNCSFRNCRIYVRGNLQMYYDPGYIFLQDTLLGTKYAVYIEDCTFLLTSGYSGGNIIDMDYGGRYVIRYSAFTDTYPEVHAPSSAVDNEPAQYGSRSFEIYENTFTSTGDKSHWGMGRVRAGTGVVYNNSFTRTGGGNTFQMIFDYTPEALGNSGLSYPAPFQPGRGRWPAETPLYNCAVGGEFPDQNLEPVYCWGNTIDSGDWYVLNSQYNLIQADRDIYFSTEHPSYSAYTYPHPLRSGGTGATDFNQSITLRF